MRTEFEIVGVSRSQRARGQRVSAQLVRLLLASTLSTHLRFTMAKGSHMPALHCALVPRYRGTASERPPRSLEISATPKLWMHPNRLMDGARTSRDSPLVRLCAPLCVLVDVTHFTRWYGLCPNVISKADSCRISTTHVVRGDRQGLVHCHITHHAGEGALSSSCHRLVQSMPSSLRYSTR